MNGKSATDGSSAPRRRARRAGGALASARAGAASALPRQAASALPRQAAELAAAGLAAEEAVRRGVARVVEYLGHQAAPLDRDLLELCAQVGLEVGRTIERGGPMRKRAIERLGRAAELRRGIERGELVLHYQPILNLQERRWERVEALVRWCHPERGLLGPDEFIPLAEETGLIVPLGERVLEMVLLQAVEWSRTHPGVEIAVNASVLQLAEPTIASELIRMLGRAGVAAETILLEVTETALMQELEIVRLALEQLVAAGVRVLIDDFGTGYSSLARLGELPIAGLKIDRRLTAGLGGTPRAGAVVRAIAEMARAHELSVVAEGIEDERALSDVDALGCHFAQGFHLGRPAPGEEVSRLLSVPPPARLG
jgi:c-di-GMP-specific phosphodiesterase